MSNATSRRLRRYTESSCTLKSNVSSPAASKSAAFSSRCPAAGPRTDISTLARASASSSGTRPERRRTVSMFSPCPSMRLATRANCSALMPFANSVTM